MFISRFKLQKTVQALWRGELIAYPTEGVWGLGCDPDNAQAVLQLLALKQRPLDKGLILVASNMKQFSPYLEGLNDTQQKTLESTWPGPHTWLVPANKAVPNWISGGKATVALRVSAHPVIVALCNAYGGPIVSTSANPAGFASPLTIFDMRTHLLSRQYLKRSHCHLPITVVPGGLQQPGYCSQIKDLTSGVVLR